MEQQDKQQQEYKDLMKSIEMPFDIDEQWEGIEHQLPQKPKKRRGIIFSFVGLLVLVAFGILLQQNWNEDDTTLGTTSVDDIGHKINSTNELLDVEIPKVNSELDGQNNLIEKDEDLLVPVVDNQNGKVSTINAMDLNDEMVSNAINSYSTSNIKSYNHKDFAEGTNLNSTPISYLSAPQIELYDMQDESRGINSRRNSKSNENSSTLSITQDFKLRVQIEVKDVNVDYDPVFLSFNKSSLLNPVVKISPLKSNVWSGGFSQQIGTLEMLFDDLVGEKDNPLNEEIKSTYFAKSSVFLMRKMNERFSLTGGLTYRIDKERINAERIIDIQERQVLSDQGSLYVDNINQTSYYEAIVTETTTTFKKIGHTNSYELLGLQLGLRYQVLDNLFLIANATQYVSFASKGKTISAQNMIIDLEDEILNGGLEFEFGTGYSLGLTQNLMLDLGVHANRTIGQRTHLRGVNRSGFSLGSSLGLRYLIKG